MTQHLKEHQGLSISPLTDRSLFKVIGEDAEKFLQGQLSCDMREVSADQSTLGSHCNPKGSMLSVFRVHSFNDHYLLSVNNQNLDASITNLNKYIMFSKAKIENLKGQWFGFGIMGENAENFVAKHFSNLPVKDQQQHNDVDKLIVKVPGERYEIWFNAELAARFTGQTDVIENLNSYALWKKQEILNGIADITPLSSASYIPQMCNLQQFTAISFKKGCYTGQEVITRLHFRGKLNKILITAKVACSLVDNEITVGDDLHCSDRQNIAKVLQLVAVEQYIYLQIVINYKYSQEPLLIQNGIAIDTLPLPYHLDPELFIRKD
jgi:folate-binding protein YgfZ